MFLKYIVKWINVNVKFIKVSVNVKENRKREFINNSLKLVKSGALKKYKESTIKDKITDTMKLLSVVLLYSVSKQMKSYKRIHDQLYKSMQYSNYTEGQLRCINEYILSTLRLMVTLNTSERIKFTRISIKSIGNYNLVLLLIFKNYYDLYLWLYCNYMFSYATRLARFNTV